MFIFNNLRYILIYSLLKNHPMEVQHLFLIFFAFSIVILSLIVFVELLIKFKRPFVLKAILCLMVFCIGWRAGAFIYIQYFGYNRWIFEPTSSIMLAASLSFFSLVFENKTKVYIICFGLLAVLVQFGVISYYSFFLKISTDVHLKDFGEFGIYISILKVGFGAVTLIINGWLVYHIYNKFQTENIYFSKLRLWSLFNLFILFIITIINFYRHSKTGINYLAEFLLFVGHFSILLTFLFRPTFLNRTDLQFSLKSFFTNKSSSKILDSLFIDIFFSKMYYLNNEATVDDLRKQLELTADELSNYIYNNYGLSTTDFINKHRIAYFIDLINTGKFQEYTIDALAQKAGFSSRFHLYKSFKKFHGGTPSDYIKSVSD